MEKYRHRDISHSVIKGYYEVYNELGTGFLESVYEKALTNIRREYGLTVYNQVPLSVRFWCKIIGKFKADMIVENKILVEIKAVSHLKTEHKAQIINYLKATEIEIGLLMNFGEEPEFKRYIFNK